MSREPDESEIIESIPIQLRDGIIHHESWYRGPTHMAEVYSPIYRDSIIGKRQAQYLSNSGQESSNRVTFVRGFYALPKIVEMTADFSRQTKLIIDRLLLKMVILGIKQNLSVNHRTLVLFLKSHFIPTHPKHFYARTRYNTQQKLNISLMPLQLSGQSSGFLIPSQLSQIVPLRIEQNLCANPRNPVLFVESHYVSTHPKYFYANFTPILWALAEAEGTMIWIMVSQQHRTSAVQCTCLR